MRGDLGKRTRVGEKRNRWMVSMVVSPCVGDGGSGVASGVAAAAGSGRI
jgi:hypothetical protein